MHVQEHSFFHREGDDLYCELTIPFHTMALGGEVKVPTLNGREELHIPGGTQPGARFKLRGKGMPNVSGRGHGDLHVIARVAVPKKLTKEQRQIIEELGRTMPERSRRRRQRVGGQAVLRAREGHLRVSADSSPALLIHFPAGTSAATRDRLVALLADHDLVAIHEDDVSSAPTCGRRTSAATARATPRRGARRRPPRRTACASSRSTSKTTTGRGERRPICPPSASAASSSRRRGTCRSQTPRSAPAPRRSWSKSSRRGASAPATTSPRGSAWCCCRAVSCASQTVIDVGTGSGVLAIVAAKLGAAFVSAIDVDPDAIENARENISRNGVDAVVEAHVRDLTEPGAARQRTSSSANLTGTLLARHAAELARARPARAAA